MSDETFKIHDDFSAMKLSSDQVMGLPRRGQLSFCIIGKKEPYGDEIPVSQKGQFLRVEISDLPDGNTVFEPFGTVRDAGDGFVFFRARACWYRFDSIDDLKNAFLKNEFQVVIHEDQ